MKVTHKDQEHLVSLSSDEVALLLDLCFAGACSYLLSFDQQCQDPCEALYRAGSGVPIGHRPAGVVGKARSGASGRLTIA